MPERWKDVPGYKRVYQVSDLGRVRRLSGFIGERYWPGRVLKPGYAGREYGSESWELDALEPRVIVNLVRDHVEDLCNQSLRDEMIQKQDDARERLEEVAEEL